MAHDLILDQSQVTVNFKRMSGGLRGVQVSQELTVLRGLFDFVFAVFGAIQGLKFSHECLGHELYPVREF